MRSGLTRMLTGATVELVHGPKHRTAMCRNAHSMCGMRYHHRLARARRDPGGTREQHELLPDFEKHLTGRRYVDAGSLHLSHITGEHGIGMPVKTAAVDF